MIDQKLNFLCSTNIFYGRGRFLDVPAYLAESGIKRILLVIDPYWWTKRSEVQDFLQEISRREISYSVTFDIEPDPSVACVERVRKSIDVDGLENLMPSLPSVVGVLLTLQKDSPPCFDMKVHSTTSSKEFQQPSRLFH